MLGRHVHWERERKATSFLPCLGSSCLVTVTGRLCHLITSVQFSSVTQLCLILCDPMDCTMPGLPVHHQLPEFTQTHVH